MKQNTKRKSETYVNQRAVITKALNVLKGIILGIICDQLLNDLERSKLFAWIDSHLFLKHHNAFGSLVDYLSVALADGVLTIEEAKDLLWMIDRNSVGYYDSVTQQIQTLHGILSGIAADALISEIELKYLWDWLNENENLKGIFPYDEIYSTVVHVGTRKSLSAESKAMLLAAFEWTENSSLSKQNPLCPWMTDPDITFKNKLFCVSGISKKMKRPELENLIVSRHGQVARNMSKKVDFLLVCAEPSIAWAHACYGRKIEEAINLRKEGAKVVIVSEKDFWDALR